MSDLEFYAAYDNIMIAFCSSEIGNNEFKRLMTGLLSLGNPNQVCPKCDCSSYVIEDTRLFYDNEFFNEVIGN